MVPLTGYKVMAAVLMRYETTLLWLYYLLMHPFATDLRHATKLFVFAFTD